MTEDQGTVARRHDPELDLTEIVLDGPLKNMAQAWAIAKVLAQSSMVPYKLQGSANNCFVTMMLGQELGLTWMQAIRGIYVLPNGTPGLRGTLLLAKIRSAGHRYAFDRTDDSCKCTITRGDEDHKIPYVGEFDLEDAKAAKLVTEKDGKLFARSAKNEAMPWELYRRDMLQWRAVARAASIGAPEVIYGFDLAGIGENDGPAAPAGVPVPATMTAEVITGSAQDVKNKLAELNEQAGGRTPAAEDDTRDAHRRAAADYDAVPEGPGNLPDDEGQEAGEGESTSVDARAAGGTSARGAQPPPPPDLKDVRELLRRCGYTTNSAQVEALSALIHREISTVSAMSAAEILMANDAITRAIRGATRAEQRHEALERVVAAERDAMDDANPFHDED